MKVKDKTVLVRVDFNSPVDPVTKKILDNTRIRASGETTIKELAKKGAKVVVLAHQGRKGDPDFIPLQQHAEILSKILKTPVKYIDDLCGEKAKQAIRSLKSGEILVLENVRTFEDETKEATPEQQAKTELVRNLAPLAELFVNDAFAAAHRAHASIIGFTPVLQSVAGRVMENELISLKRVLDNPERPVIFIFGGAKADDSLEISKYVLENSVADHILSGGVVAHVFLAARNIDLGAANMNFLQKQELMDLIPGVTALMEKYPDKIETPIDVAVTADGRREEIPVRKLPTDHSILDIGEKTINNYTEVIKKAGTIVLSGPMGVYEKKEFALGTRKVFEQVAKSRAFSLAGGGHTIAALDEFGLSKKISYISTAGGALIEFLMGKSLPGVVALEASAQQRR